MTISNQTLLNNVYNFFNVITDFNNTFTIQDLKQYFNDDFVMQLNDKVIVSGIDELYKHFNNFKKPDYKIVVKLPLDEIVNSDDAQKCVARYTIEKENLENGKKTAIKVIAIWHIKNEKLSRMNEVVFFEEASDQKITEK